MAMFYNGDPRRRQLRDEMRWLEDNFNEELSYERNLAERESWEEQRLLRKPGDHVASPKMKVENKRQTPEHKCNSQVKRPGTPTNNGKRTEEVKRRLVLPTDQHNRLGSDTQRERVQKKKILSTYKSTSKK